MERDRGEKKERKRAIDYQERIKKVKLKEIEMAHVEKRQSCTLSIVSLSDKILASQTRDWELMSMMMSFEYCKNKSNDEKPGKYSCKL
jgi:hypothetical protein